MKELINAVRKSIKDENLYSALFLAMSLPDICSRIENEKIATNIRYPAWFNKYLKQYQGYLNGDDAYALRCALHHQGSDKIVGQSKQRDLEHFVFLSSGRSHNNLMENNIINGTKESFLQLQTKIFCEDICLAVEEWLRNINRNSDLIKKTEAIIKIYEPGFTYKGAIKFE